jgi:type II secretory pathway predicted ATPase ExeA
VDTLMYEAFYGLRERPFDLLPDPRYLVLTRAHREALSNLQYGVASRKGITLLVGEAGTGKTTIVRAAVVSQPEQVHCIQVQNPALTRTEFVEMLARRFDLSDAARESKSTFLVELESLLERRRAAGEWSVLVLDEAQSLPLELLEEVRLLANMESGGEALLSVILAGQPELAARLNDQSLRQLKQRVALRCELRALTLQETSAYLVGRIHAAGGVGSQIFTREAVMLMHERARGIPRTLSVIADNALLTGFAVQQPRVNSAIVKEVCRDLDLDGTHHQPAAVVPARTPDGGEPPAPTPPPHRLLSFHPTSMQSVGSERLVEEPHTSVTATPPKRWWFSLFGKLGTHESS